MRIATFWAALAFLLTTRVAPAYYANIVIDGQFDDWVGVPVVANDVVGDGGTGPDLASLQVANDESNLYLRIVYHASVNPNAGGQPVTMLALDNDVDTGTGFDVFSMGVVGSDAGWMNDYPFQQAAGVFNAGDITGGGALIAPYNAATTNQEYAISLSAVFDAGGDVFSNSTFRLMVYTDPSAANETMGPITYTLSNLIEPAEFSQILLTSVIAFRVTNSAPSVTYSLESAAQPGPTNWVATGFRARGNGGDLLLYDPTGVSTVNLYRVMAEQ
ncbi:MAG: cell wall anchor protein [Kiritimatiellae bacterium]|nr:cell wall anchor protein [Kiritimatiellia bacterium]MCO5067795.1 cell wall anchor protein [Kiritimatiellia bacterium]